MDARDASVCKEPAEFVDSANPLESMMRRFDVAAEILGLNPGVCAYLKNPVRQVIVSIPIQMDDGTTQVSEGYRVIHNEVMGPSKGGIRCDPSRLSRVELEKITRRYTANLIDVVNAQAYAEKYRVSMRIGAYAPAIDKVEKTLNVRGI